MNKTSLRVLIASSVLAALGACAHRDSGPTATATIAPTTGNGTTGTVRFAQSGDTVRVVGEIRGLKPGDVRGPCIHGETRACWAFPSSEIRTIA